MTVKPFAIGMIALASICAAFWILFRIAHSMTMAQLEAAIRVTSVASMGGCLLAIAASSRHSATTIGSRRALSHRDA